MEAAASLINHAALMRDAMAHDQVLAAATALSKASVKHTLDTGLTVTGLVLVGVGSFVAKRKQHHK